jgi:hypothetical protein
MSYQSVGDFPVDVMMNQFDLSDWNYSDDSDLSSFINRITPIRVWAGTKNSRSVAFLR